MGICQNIGLLENDGKLNICQCIGKDREVLPSSPTRGRLNFATIQGKNEKTTADDLVIERIASTYFDGPRNHDLISINGMKFFLKMILNERKFLNMI